MYKQFFFLILLGIVSRDNKFNKLYSMESKATHNESTSTHPAN